MDRNGSTIKLATKRSAGVAPEVYLRNLLDADDEAYKQGNLPLKPRADVTKTGISGATQKELMSSIFLFEINIEKYCLEILAKITFAPHFRDIPDKPLYSAVKLIVVFLINHTTNCSQ